MPVQQRIIQADFEPFGPEGFQVFSDDVPAKGGVGDLIVGQCAVKEAETVVVFGRQHRVLHPGLLGHAGPGAGIEVHGVEGVKVGLVGLHRDAFDAAHPLPAGRDGIEPPVQEEAKAIVLEPLDALGACGMFVHEITLLDRWLD